MCFFGGGSKQSQPIAPPAPPAPSPIPSASESSPAATAENRRARIAAMKYGMLNTMKTGGRGVTGKGADLISQEAGGKKVLGA